MILYKRTGINFIINQGENNAKVFNYNLFIDHNKSCSRLFFHKRNGRPGNPGTHQTKQRRKKEIITDADLKNLPEPVRRYLKFAGVVGKEKIRIAHVKFSGELKRAENQPWMHVNVEQVSGIENPSRIFYISAGFFPFISMTGRDGYIDGKGNMLGRLTPLITLFDMKGPELDRSALVTFLNNMVFIPTAFLNSYVKWEKINDGSTKAVIMDRGNTVSGIFYFDETGEITNMITTGRYRDENGRFIREKWTTPLRNYIELNGFKIPSEGDATHQNTNGGEYVYARFRLVSLEYNNTNIHLK